MQSFLFKTMAYFTAEQISEIAQALGLTFKSVEVRDGYATQGSFVWWRCSDGPEYVELQGDHLLNCKKHPFDYQIKQPRTQITYMDE